MTFELRPPAEGKGPARVVSREREAGKTETLGSEQPCSFSTGQLPWEANPATPQSCPHQDRGQASGSHWASVLP